MSATLTEQVQISLEANHGFDECAQFATPLYEQLSNGYDHCSVMRIPETLEDWRAEHKTARKRADHCRSLGYRFVLVKRHEREEEIFAINTSKAKRQGRPMSPAYRERPSFPKDEHYRCYRHGVHAYGVHAPGGLLVAYLWLYRSGELALVSSILGHGGFLAHDVMFLLFEGVVGLESTNQPGWFVYNKANSGQQGLRDFKARLGFEPMEVSWRA